MLDKFNLADGGKELLLHFNVSKHSSPTNSANVVGDECLHFAKNKQELLLEFIEVSPGQSGNFLAERIETSR